MEQKKDKEQIILELVYQLRVWEAGYRGISDKWEEVTKIVNSKSVILSQKTIINNFYKYLCNLRKSDKTQIYKLGYNQIETERIKLFTELVMLIPK